MIPFSQSDEHLVALFEQPERDVLDQLASEIHDLLGESESFEPGSSSARAITRLLPAAYEQDPEYADEFRRFTKDGLVEGKRRNAAVVRESLAGATPVDGRFFVALDASQAQSWLRSLTDIRLTLAAALGIEIDGDEARKGSPNSYAVEVYAWLGYVQETLLDGIEG